MADVSVAVTETPVEVAVGGVPSVSVGVGVDESTVTLVEVAGDPTTLELVPAVTVVEVGVPGPEGPEGPEGSPGASGDTHYTHIQNSASATWTINHNLMKFPSVTLVDGTGAEMEASVSHTSANICVATFSQAESGKAYLN